MKKLIILFLLVSVTCVLNAQKSDLTTKVSLFKPVPSNLFKSQVAYNTTVGAIVEVPSAWFLRLTAGAVTTRNTYDKVTKKWNTAPMSAVGMGAGYQHYTALADGTPYNNYGFNLLLLTSVRLFDQEQATMGVGLFATFFQFINVGFDYMPGLEAGNKFGIDTGVTLKF